MAEPPFSPRLALRVLRRLGIVSLGFDARCATATMMVRPGIRPNHGTVIVHCGAQRYPVDASILFGEPLLLESQVTTVAHGAWGVQCRPERVHAAAARWPADDTWNDRACRWCMNRLNPAAT